MNFSFFWGLKHQTSRIGLSLISNDHICTLEVCERDKIQAKFQIFNSLYGQIIILTC